MADSTAQDLVKRALVDLASITGVRLWSGKDGELNALGVELSELLSSDIVINGSITYQGLTPAGFYNTVMSESQRGIGTYATETEIQGKITEALLRSNKQVIMQTQWKKDWFAGNGVANQYQAKDQDLSVTKTINYQICWEGNLTANVLQTLHPVGKPGSLGFTGVYVQVYIDVNGFAGNGISVALFSSSAGERTIQLGTTGIYLVLTTDGLELGIRGATAATNVRMAMTVQGAFD